MTLKDKMSNSVVSSKREKGKWLEQKTGGALIFFVFFRERERDFSLVFRQIRPSAVFGTRRKVALRGEAYAWVPDLRSLDKLREVWDLSYLGFTLYLSVL